MQLRLALRIGRIEQPVGRPEVEDQRDERRRQVALAHRAAPAAPRSPPGRARAPEAPRPARAASSYQPSQRLRTGRASPCPYSRGLPSAPLASSTAPSTRPACPGRTCRRCAARGVDARLVVFERYRLHPEADESLEPRAAAASRARQLAQWRALRAPAAAHGRLPLLLRADARAEAAAVPAPARVRPQEAVLH